MAVAEQMPILAEAQLANVAELRHARMLIDGAWVDGMSGEFLNVENPAKRCPIARVPRGDTADVNGAVAAAAKAFPGWSRTAPRDRGRMLLRIAEALETALRGTRPYDRARYRQRAKDPGAARGAPDGRYF